VRAAMDRRVPLYVLLLVCWLAATVSVANAQEGGPPPLPLVYADLKANVAGEPVVNLGGVTVTVGDWSRRAERQPDGRYLLIVSPPSQSYVGQEVTFELNGARATLSYPFPALSQPRVETVTLEFAPPAAAGVREAPVQVPWLLIGGIGGGAMLAFGGVLLGFRLLARRA